MYKNRAKLAAVVAAGNTGVNGVTAAMIQDRIYDAACMTYTWMRNTMMTRLEVALPGVERVYYNAYAEKQSLTGNDYRVGTGEFAGVMKETIRKNDEVLESNAGFVKKNP